MQLFSEVKTPGSENRKHKCPEARGACRVHEEARRPHGWPRMGKTKNNRK